MNLYGTEERHLHVKEIAQENLRFGKQCIALAEILLVPGSFMKLAIEYQVFLRPFFPSIIFTFSHFFLYFTLLWYIIYVFLHKKWIAIRDWFERTKCICSFCFLQNWEIFLIKKYSKCVYIYVLLNVLPFLPCYICLI